MPDNSNERLTIDKLDQSKPLDEWKPLVADFGRRRHLSYSMDFDTRASLIEEPADTLSRESHQRRSLNLQSIRSELGREFGSDQIDAKVQNFIDLKSKPFSIMAYHNEFFDQARHAFVIGAYYPALVGARALGERILNHLVLDLRDSYRSTPEYRNVYRKNSFDNWQVPINTLEAWGVLLPAAVVEFRSLAILRNRSIHFNVSTYATVRDDALSAMLHMREIIDQQFASWGAQPWFIKGTLGHKFIARGWERDPFVKAYYLPTCPFVGPNFGISLANGLAYYDQNDYSDGDWTDEEFARVFNNRTADQVISPRSTVPTDN